MIIQLRIAILLFMMLLPASALAQNADLERAYQKEFSYLKAQKEALQKRLTEVNGDATTRTRQASAEIDRLQGQLVTLTMQADELEDTLIEAQRNTSTMEDRSDTLVGVLEQSKASLAKYDVELPEPSDAPAEHAAAIETAFAHAAELLAEGGAIRKTQGGFFDQDGKRVEGDLIHVGRVASYGVSPGASGALAPAGEGRLKLWHEPSASYANALNSGDSVPTLGMFLYENLDRPIDEKKAKTALEVIQAGGVIAWVIVMLGLLGLVLTVLRSGYLLWVGQGRTKLADAVVAAIRAGNVKRAIQLGKEASGPLGRVVVDTLEHLGREREIVEDIAAEAVLRETPALERFGNVIMVFAAVAPLLGLLGTVTGMISTFDIITEYGTGDPKMLSGGISEALITTQLGLIVAIPALLLGNLLNSRANAILNDLEHTALRVINAADLPCEPAGPEEFDRPAPSRPNLTITGSVA